MFLKIVTIVNPEPGNWTITAGSTEKHSVKIVGKSDLNFDFGFSQKKTKKFSETTKRPLTGFHCYDKMQYHYINICLY